jgi:hypothetical protein
MERSKKITALLHRACLICALLFATASNISAYAQVPTPTIEASAEEFQYTCQLANDSGPGVRTIYIRHNFNIGATGSRFKIVLGSGATMTYLSETHPIALTVGDVQSGITFCYGTCTQDVVLLATVNYMSYATDENCSEVLVAPHPDAETVEVMGCDGSPMAAWVRDLNLLAPHGICGCPQPHIFAGTAYAFNCNALSTEQSTWGAVKALYR